MLNRVEITEYSRVNIVVYTLKYPITVPMVGIGRKARFNARCFPIPTYMIVSIIKTICGQYSCVKPCNRKRNRHDQSETRLQYVC